MDLVDTIPNISLRFYAVPSQTPHLTDLEVKVKDLECFLFNEMSISHQSVIRKYICIHLSIITTLEGLLPYYNC